MSVTIGNVCFIHHPNENKILLLKRNREPLKGMYTGVGGKTNFEEDIHSSCLREVREETGLSVSEMTLKGVIKTIFELNQSSWILFIYTAKADSAEYMYCEEGELQWVDRDKVDSLNLMGFIHELLPHVLNPAYFIEGTVKHDSHGNILKKEIFLMRIDQSKSAFIEV